MWKRLLETLVREIANMYDSWVACRQTPDSTFKIIYHTILDLTTCLLHKACSTSEIYRYTGYQIAKHPPLRPVSVAAGEGE